MSGIPSAPIWRQAGQHRSGHRSRHREALGQERQRGGPLPPSARAALERTAAVVILERAAQRSATASLGELSCPGPRRTHNARPQVTIFRRSQKLGLCDFCLRANSSQCFRGPGTNLRVLLLPVCLSGAKPRRSLCRPGELPLVPDWFRRGLSDLTSSGTAAAAFGPSSLRAWK